MIRPKTIFIDIDGTIFEHGGERTLCTQGERPILPGVKDKFNEWDAKGYNIILVSGRRESDRKVTEEQLAHYGLFYDQLILGISGGIRVLINDTKPGTATTDLKKIGLRMLENTKLGNKVDITEICTAEAITVARNSGLEDIDI